MHVKLEYALMCKGPCFSGIFTKGDNFCNCLFASLYDIALPYGYYS